MITIKGISGKELQTIHDYYMPKTVITSHRYDINTELFDVTITDHAIIKINLGEIVIDLGGVLYTIANDDYISLIVV